MIKFTRKRQWIAVIVFILVVLVGLVVALVIRNNSTTTKPANLGSGLEYVGQQTVGGCFLWICESQPYTEYYFATDMTLGELETYFTKATFVGIERETYPTVPKDESDYRLKYTYSLANDGFSIKYYDNTDYIVSIYNLRKTSRTHVIRVLESSYKLAKSAL